MIKPKNQISVADYLTQQINISGKPQKEIAEECGYTKPNVITMFKQGSTKLPINKVPAMAKSLGVDPIHLLRVVMREYMPETWEVIESLVGKSLISSEEFKIIELIREVSGGQVIAPRTSNQVEELQEVAQKWREDVEKSAQASRERVERENPRMTIHLTK